MIQFHLLWIAGKKLFDAISTVQFKTGATQKVATFFQEKDFKI